MISQKEAEQIIRKEFPDCKVQKQILFNNFFVFLLDLPDPEEPACFVKVDTSTGAFTDFSPWNESNPEAFEKAFLA